MRRRASPAQAQQMTPGGEWGSKTPVESHRNEQAGIKNDVTKPGLQAALVSIALVQLVLSFFALIVTAGPVAFWISAGCCGLAATIWLMLFASTWWQDGIDPNDILAVLLMAVVVGTVAYCVGVVSSWMLPNGVRIEMGQRKILFWTIRAHVWTLPPWGALAWFVMSASFWLHLELSLLQRLALPSLFQDQALWGALGNLLEWIVKRREQRPPAPERPIMNHSERNVAKDKLPPSPEQPVPLSEIECFLRVALTRGALSRDKLAGAIMENGKRLTKNVWRRCIDILVEQGYVANGGAGYGWTLGNNAQTALDALV